MKYSVLTYTYVMKGHFDSTENYQLSCFMQKMCSSLPLRLKG